MSDWPLDETKPVINSASIDVGKVAGAAATKRFALSIKAHDKTSGLGKVQAAVDKRRPGKPVRYVKRASVHSASRPKAVRVQDRAGNRSSWELLR